MASGVELCVWVLMPLKTHRVERYIKYANAQNPLVDGVEKLGKGSDVLPMKSNVRPHCCTGHWQSESANSPDSLGWVFTPTNPLGESLG
ncbi:hypothetical protein TNCV_1393741 [Trichonephila clavipes]|nr:hypothetical protein TNCV_1393741 [Trichonephila clavipes]